MKKKKNYVKYCYWILIFSFLGVLGTLGYKSYRKYVYENKILKQIVKRLESDHRIAEVLVTKMKYHALTNQYETTIKFLEYDSQNQPLSPKYFNFKNNIIQFQSLVVRFNDIHIERGDFLKGKSVYLFWKIFVLDGANTQEYEITKVNSVPEGYKLTNYRNVFEEALWGKFWEYALDSKKAIKKGIKNAQIEAPGMKFVPGILYTLKIEHDGGIRIDTAPIPAILKGEKID